MTPPAGRRVPLSLPRKWMTDLMWVSRGIPAVTAERRMILPELIEARERAADPPPWAAVVLKGFAAVAARTPALRRSYQRFPRPHLYESRANLASVAVARHYDGGPAVFFGLLTAPENQPLRQLAGHLRDFKTRPVGDVGPFARLIRYSRYPLPVRRAFWWLGMNLSGRRRAKTIGTFGLSTVAGAGAALANLVTPVAAALTYGPFDPDGAITVRLTFDHRVMDGLTAADALADLETELRTTIVAELAGLAATAVRSGPRLVGAVLPR